MIRPPATVLGIGWSSLPWRTPAGLEWAGWVVGWGGWGGRWGGRDVGLGVPEDDVVMVVVVMGVVVME